MFVQHAVPLVSACRVSNYIQDSSSATVGQIRRTTMKMNRCMACLILSFLSPSEEHGSGSSSSNVMLVTKESVVDCNNIRNTFEMIVFKNGRFKQ